MRLNNVFFFLPRIFTGSRDRWNNDRRLSETVSVLQHKKERYPGDGPKAETKWTLQTPHGGGRLAKAGKSAQDVWQRFLALPQSLVAQAVAENWHVMAIVSKSGKERKDSPVPCYCFPGTSASWYAENNGLLPMTSNISCQKSPTSWKWRGFYQKNLDSSCRDLSTCATKGSPTIHKKCALPRIHIIGPIFFQTTINWKTGRWHSIIFNKMRCVTHLKWPWKKWNYLEWASTAPVSRHASAGLFSVGFAEDHDV